MATKDHNRGKLATTVSSYSYNATNNTWGGKGHKTKNDQSKKSQLSLVNLKKRKNRFVLLYSEYNIVLIHAHAHTSECL